MQMEIRDNVLGRRIWTNNGKQKIAIEIRSSDIREDVQSNVLKNARHVHLYVNCKLNLHASIHKSQAFNSLTLCWSLRVMNTHSNNKKYERLKM